MKLKNKRSLPAGRHGDSTFSTSEIVEQLKCKSSGFTLIEVLVSGIIFALTIGVAIASFSSSTAVQMKNQIIREVAQNGRYVIENISRDVKMANADILYSEYSAFEVVGNELTINTFDQTGNRKTVIYEYIPPQDQESGKIMYDGYNLTHEEYSIEQVGDNPVFQQNIYNPSSSLGEIQQTLKIKFRISNFRDGRASETISEVFETSVTTRSYPGFN